MENALSFVSFVEVSQLPNCTPLLFRLGCRGYKRLIHYDVKHGLTWWTGGLGLVKRSTRTWGRSLFRVEGGAPSRLYRLCPTIHSSWTLRFSTIDSFPCDLKETVIVMGLQKRWILECGAFMEFITLIDLSMTWRRPGAVSKDDIHLSGSFRRVSRDLCRWRAEKMVYVRRTKRMRRRFRQR
jgi:hypothetical protein